METLQTEAEIIADCEATGRPYEDPHFPPAAESLGSSLVQARWLRPHEAFGPVVQLFPAHGEACAHVSLGTARLGDSYLLGALAAVSARPALVQRLFVSTRGARWGVYTLQLWRHDEWVQVMVDSTLPCDPATGAPLYACPRLEGGFWLALVEKAVAKLAGSYAALSGSSTASGATPRGAAPATFLDALRDLTGGIPVAFPSRPPDLSWERLLALVESGAPVALTRRGRSAAGSQQGLSLDATPTRGGAVPPLEAGELLRGLPYPLVRANVQRRLLCFSSPWTAGSRHREPVPSAKPLEALPDVPTDASFWLAFDELPLYFDEVLTAEAPHDPTAQDARDGSRRRLFVDGVWPDASVGGARPCAAFVLRLAVPMRLTAVLCQRAGRRGAPVVAAALLVVASTDGAALEAIAGRAPLPSRLVSRHSLPPRAQREVVLDSDATLQPGTYYLLAHRVPQPAGAPPPPPFWVQIEAEWRRLGGGGVGRDGVGAAREAWSDDPAANHLACAPLRDEQLPPLPLGGGAPALRIAGDEGLDALLGQSAPPEPPPEDEAAIEALLAALAAVPARAAAAARIQAQLRGKRERFEMDEMRVLLQERADAAATVLQAAVRAAPARREGSGARRARAVAEQEAELGELARLGSFLSDKTLKVQKVVRGNSARKLFAPAQPSSALAAPGPRPLLDSAEAQRDAEPHSVHARLARIEELLLLLGQGGVLPRRPAAAEVQAAAVRTIQSHTRGLSARSGVAATRAAARREAEARRIQALARGAGGRRTARELRRKEAAQGLLFAVQPFDRYAFGRGGEGSVGRMGEGTEVATDEWRYVPRHAAKAAAAAALRSAHRSLEPSAEATAAAARLLVPSAFGAPGQGEAELQPLGYRSRVLELQRRQRAAVASLPLRRPERVARLLVEKDAALEKLAEMHAGGMVAKAELPRRGGELSALFAEQRAQMGAQMERAMVAQRDEYQAAMRELAAELRHVPAPQLQSVARLNQDLESALDRVLELESRAANVVVGPTPARGKSGAPESQVCAVM